MKSKRTVGQLWRSLKWHSDYRSNETKRFDHRGIFGWRIYTNIWLWFLGSVEPIWNTFYFHTNCQFTSLFAVHFSQITVAIYLDSSDVCLVFQLSLSLSFSLIFSLRIAGYLSFKALIVREFFIWKCKCSYLISCSGHIISWNYDLTLMI